MSSPQTLLGHLKGIEMDNVTTSFTHIKLKALKKLDRLNGILCTVRGAFKTNVKQIFQMSLPVQCFPPPLLTISIWNMCTIRGISFYVDPPTCKDCCQERLFDC